MSTWPGVAVDQSCLPVAAPRLQDLIAVGRNCRPSPPSLCCSRREEEAEEEARLAREQERLRQQYAADQSRQRAKQADTVGWG